MERRREGTEAGERSRREGERKERGRKEEGERRREEGKKKERGRKEKERREVQRREEKRREETRGENGTDARREQTHDQNRTTQEQNRTELTHGENRHRNNEKGPEQDKNSAAQSPRAVTQLCCVGCTQSEMLCACSGSVLSCVSRVLREAHGWLDDGCVVPQKNTFKVGKHFRLRHGGTVRERHTRLGTSARVVSKNN